VTEVDKAIEHAFNLFREHVERYREEILIEPVAWRRRCDELHKDLQWLLFCRDHPLPRAPKKLPPNPPPPPLRR
jgi:hypothetical protein